MLTALISASPLMAEGPKVTVDSRDRTVSAVLKRLKHDTGYEFFYNDSHIDGKRAVKVNAKDQDLSAVLDMLFRGTDIHSIIRDRQVILTRRAGGNEKPGTKRNDRNGNTSESHGVKVSGTVVDESGEPLIGATIHEKGTSNGAATDLEGNFSLNVESANSRLVVNYVGFDQVELKAGGGNPLTVVMKENASSLNEVVVIGYGSMKKRDLTGSVSSVKINETTAATVSSVSNALAGKAAGLQVSVNNAQPGAGSTFRIRGAASPNSDNSPLIIIDGFLVNPTSDSKTSVGKYDSGSNDNFLGSINPNDIESIEVLKDASSTAIYGARAGHGVILITTKKGQKGRAKVNYSGSVSLQTIAKNYRMLDAAGFMTESERYLREMWRIDNYVGIFGGKDEDEMMQSNPYVPKFTADQIANPGPTTDWMDAVTRTGFQTQHNLSVSGGTDAMRYLVSGNVFLQNGIVKNNDLKRYTLRTNIDQKFNKHFSGGINMTLSRMDQNSIPGGSSHNEDAGVIVAASQSNPLLPIRNEDGTYTINPERAYLPNPVSLLEITNVSRRDRFLGSVYLEYRPIEELVLKLNAGMDHNAHKRKVYLPKTTLYGAKVNGQADIAQYDQNDYLLEFTASYNNTFAEDHRLNVVAGASYQNFNKEGVNAGNSDFLSDALLYNALSFGRYAKPWVGSSNSSDEMASVFGRVNYSYKGRYLLTATLRADGSSYFAKGHQWGYFPSVALGWRFADEEFLAAANSWLSNGKLRLSWGQTGNSSIGYQTISLYRDRDNYGNVFVHGFGGTANLGFQLTQLGNPDITWETTTEWNIGLDLGFINNRIGLSVDFFKKEISNLLNWRPLQHIQEVLSIADNIGSTQSHGLEISLNTVNIENRNFTWTTDLTFQFYRDRWKTRADSWSPAAYQQYDGWIRPWEGFYVADGLVQPGEEIPYMPNAIPGQIKVKDINGYTYNEDGTFKTDEHGLPILTGEPDGKINDADRITVGSRDPGFIMGFNNTFKYRDFDLNIYFYGHFNQWTTGAYQDIWLGSVQNIANGSNMPTSASEIWSTDNPDGWRPGYAQRYNTYDSGSTTFYLKKCWFVRCRNITLGYRIPVKRLDNLRVYVDVTNPFILSNYKGLDMETDDSQWAYPNVRSFSFGIDLTF